MLFFTESLKRLMFQNKTFIESEILYSPLKHGKLKNHYNKIKSIIMVVF